jgi:hypothetical protein
MKFLRGRGHKRRLSQFSGETSCNQEETGGLEQGLDDEALAVPLVPLRGPEDRLRAAPGVCSPAARRCCARPASASCPAWSRAAGGACGGGARRRRPGTARGWPRRPSGPALRAAGQAPPLFRDHGPDLGHDGKRHQEQALEQHRIIDVGTGSGTGDRHAITGHRDVVKPARSVASTRTVSAGGCPGLGSLGPSQCSITVAIRSKILGSNSVSLPVAKGQRWGSEGEPRGQTVSTLDRCGNCL